MFQESEWVDDNCLQLFTDAAGNKELGCGCYFNGQWACFKWPVNWEESTFKDITYLELVPIILAFTLWSADMKHKKILLRSDNLALVEILNKKSSKNKKVMQLIRQLVLLTLHNNIMIKSKHVSGKMNTICDSISRFQFDRLFQVLPQSAMREPCSIPQEFLEIFEQK